MGRIGATVLAALALLATTTAAPPAARADDAAAAARVDNPRYALWAKCKPGSSATLVCDVGSGGSTKIKITHTLRAVAADAATVANATVMSTAGNDSPAGEPVTEQVTAMGRTFACKVYAVSAPVGEGVAGFNRATISLSDDVPGGLVKLVANGKRGPATYLLTDMNLVK